MTNKKLKKSYTDYFINKIIEHKDSKTIVEDDNILKISLKNYAVYVEISSQFFTNISVKIRSFPEPDLTMFYQSDRIQHLDFNILERQYYKLLFMYLKAIKSHRLSIENQELIESQKHISNIL